MPVMTPARRPAPSPFTRRIDSLPPGGVCLYNVLLAGPHCGLHSSQRCCKIPAPPSCSFVLQFTLVDASLAPFFLRLPVLKQYRGFDLPPVRLDTCCVLLHLLCRPHSGQLQLAAAEWVA